MHNHVLREGTVVTNWIQSCVDQQTARIFF